jgi:hypothetical protein
MSLILDGTQGITSSGGTNVLQGGAVKISNIDAANTPNDTNFLRGDGSWQPVDVSGEIALFAAGEPGQPRLVGNAVSVFPGTYPVLTVTASDAHSVNNGLGTTVVSNSTTSTSFQDATRHVILKYTGSINFRVILSRPGQGSGTAECRVLKNGVVVQTFSASVDTFGTVQGPVNISVIPTDVILWQVRAVTAGTALVNNGSNTASNGYLLRELFAPAV